MTLRRFVPADLLELNEWLRARPPVRETSMDRLPNLGVIEEGVACGFMAKTPLPIAILIGFASNPMIPSTRRGLALRAIADDLIERAKESGVKRLILHSAHRGILRWTVENNWQSVGRDDGGYYMLGSIE